MRWRNVPWMMACMVFHVGGCIADDALPSDFGDLSLEQLGDIRVTSVSKRSQRLASAPASIYVISAEAIRRSGARSLPQALQLAPNLLVAQIDASQYAISARGFNSHIANKLLVLIDGRTVYTPLYSGVFWDVQDVLLSDIDRIEVISGPGGTLWGANAVNGVINIITKEAKATTGNSVSMTTGSLLNRASVRHGSPMTGVDGYYRTYAKLQDWRHTTRADGSTVYDGFDRAQAGFRADWRTGTDQMTMQGDVYQSYVDQTSTDKQSSVGGNLLARWERPLATGGSVRVQTYYDRTVRDVPNTYSDHNDTFDIDVQHTLANQGNGQTIWGGGYRFTNDKVGNSAVLAFLPVHRQLQWGNLFVQRESLLPQNFRLTVGAKLEYNSDTHVEFLPNLKLAWSPDDNQLLWLGLSRAIRAPARLDTDVFFPAQPPFLLEGGPHFRSEVLDNLGLGWRIQADDRWSASVTTFISQYNHLRSVETTASGTFIIANGIKSHVNGLEAWGSYQASKTWQLDAGVLFLNAHLSGENLSLAALGNDPHQQWHLRSRWNIREDKTFDLAMRHVGELPSPTVSAYTAVDARLGWRVSKTLDVFLTGRNLFDPSHPEFIVNNNEVANPIEIARTFDLTFTVAF